MLDQMNGAILRWVSKYFTHQVVLEIQSENRLVGVSQNPF